MTRPPDLAPSELRYLVLAAQREGARQYSRALDRFSLTVSQAEIVLVLEEFGPLSLRDLGQLIVCEAGSPSRIVEALVSRDLLERNVDPNDRRSTVLRLTPNGAELVPGLRSVETAIDAATSDVLDADEKSAVASALRKFLLGTATGDTIERRFADKRYLLVGDESVEERLHARG
ncbi:MarR family winged helix-turn-helix transcriptional regulator, partial [Conyzicola sp.]|uniref:MarR family winged helix-turn-helix transcriptional regulator n=1 Tax=Conyzicola sp. TaxID=1969404 RepID=UPI0039891193